MPSKKNTELPPKIATRLKDAETHPGAAMPKQKRRTKAQIQADEEEKQRKKDEEVEKKAAGLKRIAGIEDEVAEQDANLVTPRPKPRPRTAALKRTISYRVLPMTIDTEEQQETDIDEPSEFDPAPQEDNNEDSELTEIDESPKKKAKVSTRDAIQASRRNKSKEDKMKDSDQMDIDGLDKPHGKTVQAKPKAFVRSHMLTLDETTLYYYMYSFDSKPDALKLGLVRNWVAKPDIFSAPPKSNLKSGGSINTGS